MCKLTSSLGSLRFGIDGDNNYGYYKADDSFVPFKSGLKTETIVVSAGIAKTVSLGYRPKRVLIWGLKNNDFLLGICDTVLNINFTARGEIGGGVASQKNDIVINDDGFSVTLSSNELIYISNGTVYYICEE